jgi:hypothetical protein
MRYIIPFGSANAGGTPTFLAFTNTSTWAEIVPQPALTVIDAAGRTYFDVDWATSTATSINFVATYGGLEPEGTINSDGTATGSVAVATAATSSLVGFETVGPILARAAVEAGILALTPAQISSFDPFASTNATILQMLRLLDGLGRGLATEIKAHLEREFTITTAGSATSYALPADYLEMVPRTLWNSTSKAELAGSVTPQGERYLKAWNASNAIVIPFRAQGNRITFPTAPANGYTLTGLYYSRYWIQTASATAPDADHATARTDYVLFDPELVTLGLKWRILQAKGMPLAAIALAEYEQRLEWAKGAVSSAPVLSLSGGRSGFRAIDTFNLPDTGYGS